MKDIDLVIEEGRSASIECSNDYSDLLVDLIIGKEMPAKGEIYLGDKKNIDFLKDNRSKIGVILREDAMYEGMTIDGYMRLFAELLNTKLDYRDILLKLALLDISKTRIKNLSFSQKRRLSFARERMKEPKLMIIQEPILNLDRDSAKIITENIEELCSTNTAILTTSVYFKNTILVGEKAYRLDYDGMIEMEAMEESPLNENSIDSNKIYKIEKIPAKLEEKILLFDPMEIDYVESVQGVNYLYIRGESFPCSLSLTELEERLKFFGFFRCHRSYLINLQRVKEVVTWTRNSYSLSLGDKTKSSIPLSKGRLEDLKMILKL
jgi:ABC-2 type transport system ATP-binding protein